MRFPSRATSTPVGAAPGTLTFSSVPAGKGASSSCATKRAVNVAATAKSKADPTRKSSSRARDCCETAIPGNPSTIASSAAATVPE